MLKTEDDVLQKNTSPQAVDCETYLGGTTEPRWKCGAGTVVAEQYVFESGRCVRDPEAIDARESADLHEALVGRGYLLALERGPNYRRYQRRRGECLFWVRTGDTLLTVRALGDEDIVEVSARLSLPQEQWPAFRECCKLIGLARP
jgi:hypothetical protein